mgnify:CR=1 FL=1
MRLQSMATISVLALALVGGCDDTKKDATDDKAKDGAPSAEGKSAGAAKDEPAPAEPEGPVYKTEGMVGEVSSPLVDIDLGPMELAGLVITAPEDAKIEAKSPSGHKLVWAAGNYSITIREGGDLEQNKETFKMLDPEGKYVREDSDVVIFERSSGGSHLLAATVEVDGKAYTCSTVATAMSFQRDQADQMVESCKTLRKKG